MPANAQMFWCRAFTAFIVVLAMSTPALAQTLPSTQTNNATPSSWVINLRDTELRVFAEQVSSITGRTLILDPAVKGQVTVISAEPLDAAAVWELFQSVLRVNGFAALQSGSAWRIVPQANVNQGGAPLDQSEATRSQNLITRLIVLRNLPSDSAARVLRPLIAAFGYLDALPKPNAIIVTDNADNVRRVEELARLLDHGDGSRVETIPLAHAAAKTIAPLIERMLAGEGTGNTTAAGPKVLADERSNALIVRADPSVLVEIRRIVDRLDAAGSGTGLTTRVFRLKHADAEDVIAILKGLVGGRSAGENPVANALNPEGSSTAQQLSDLTPSAQSILGQALSPQGTFQNSSGNSSLGIGASGSSGNASFGGGFNGGSGRQNGRSGAGSTGFSSNDLAIQSDPSLNAIVVRGSPAVVADIDHLIQELDIRRPQVLIEAAIVEITGDDAENFGVQLGVGAAAPVNGGVGGTSFSANGVSISQVLTALASPAASIVAQDGLSIGLSRKNEFGVLIQALATSSKANLLSTPSVTTLDNEDAEIIVGQNVPFRTGSYTTTTVGATPFTTIERQDVGITLKVLPRVTDGDVIRLQLEQEVSSLQSTSVAGAADLITNKRDIQTTVLADNGQTIALGGLITNNETGTNSKVPVLGDLPLIGPLFGDQQKSRSKQTLFVFLRATILRDRESVAAAASHDYERVRAIDASPETRGSLLLAPTLPKLPPDLEGIY